MEQCLNHKWLTSTGGAALCLTTTMSLSSAGPPITSSSNCHMSNNSDSGHSTESTLDEVVNDDDNHQDNAVTNVTISLNRHQPPASQPPAPASPNTITSCTIGKNGSIIVEEVEEAKLLERQNGHSADNDKENRHHHHRFNQGVGGGVAEPAPALFPDAPTTPKVCRKIAPLYSSLRAKCAATSAAVAAAAAALTDEDTVLLTTNVSPSAASTTQTTPRGSLTVTVTINGDDRHASTTRIHICPPD